MKQCAMLCLVLATFGTTSPLLSAEDTPFVASASQPPLPKIKSLRRSIYYPDRAKRLRAEGRTLLAFNIDSRGRPVQISIESTDGSKLLTDSAVEILSGTVFNSAEVPAPPGLGSQRYRLSVVFELTPCGRLQHFEVPKDARVSVCGSSIP
jgi:TonB family protein